MPTPVVCSASIGLKGYEIGVVSGRRADCLLHPLRRYSVPGIALVTFRVVTNIANGFVIGYSTRSKSKRSISWWPPWFVFPFTVEHHGKTQ